MVNQQLVAFIRDNASQGYNLYQIRSHLIQSGYNTTEVDEAMKDFQKPSAEKKKITIPTIPIIVALVLVILLIIGAFFIFRSPSSGSNVPFSASIESTSTGEIKPGESFSFEYEIENLGSRKLSGVEVELLLKDSSGSTVDSKTASVNVQTITPRRDFFQIPSDAEGSYSVQMTVTYGDDEEQRNLRFDVITEQRETCFDRIQNQDEEGVDCGGVCRACATTTTIAGGTTTTLAGTTTTLAGTTTTLATTTTMSRATTTLADGKPSWEIIEDIMEIAQTDAEKAGEECGKQVPDVKDKCYYELVRITGNKDTCILIANPTKKDSCILIAAQTKQVTDWCLDIQGDAIRDQCLMEFVLNNEDYSLCEHITNVYEKRACEGLRLARS